MGEKCEAYRNRNTGFDVLSFDGGGTKGVMEAVIVKDIMNMATLLIENPERIKDLCIKMLEENPDEDDQPNLKKIAEQLKGVESPVHPIEVFDMIVGTSTGKRFKLSACVFTSTGLECLHAASTITLSKDIDKYAFMSGSNFYERDINTTE